MTDLRVATASGVAIAGEQEGQGPAVIGLHGLTATRRYVLMGSRALARSGHRVVLYDARGHGQSAPAPTPADYGYGALAADLEAVLDALGIERAVIAGASMGAHTALRLALRNPRRVAALALITPGHDPEETDDGARLARWDALAAGLRDGGVDGFLAAYGDPQVPAQWRDTVTLVIRQRLGQHAHPLAVADALRGVPRSSPFEDWGELASIAVPTLVVASRDEADPGHPLAVARRYAEAIPAARLAVEEPGSSPLAWQGGQLSRLLAELVAQADVATA